MANPLSPYFKFFRFLALACLLLSAAFFFVGVWLFFKGLAGGGEFTVKLIFLGEVTGEGAGMLFLLLSFLALVSPLFLAYRLERKKS
jgi:hypothetical protein